LNSIAGHLPFVHAESFQASAVWVQSSPKITQLERGVRVERWIENARPNGQPGPHDHWNGYHYLIPGVLIMWGANFEVGTARATNFAQPDLSSSGKDAILQIQTITPMTERTSRYHFRFGVHRERTDDLSFVDKFIPVTYQAFNEDRRMIEAQQRVVDRDPERQIMPTVHDRGVLMYNRLKARLIAEERGGQKNV
jgi:phenylpropionate dioxygenase-like ring-hydroxylating dioxygenase large terminal subunit